MSLTPKSNSACKCLENLVIRTWDKKSCQRKVFETNKWLSQAVLCKKCFCISQYFVYFDSILDFEFKLIVLLVTTQWFLKFVSAFKIEENSIAIVFLKQILCETNCDNTDIFLNGTKFDFSYYFRKEGYKKNLGCKMRRRI